MKIPLSEVKEGSRVAVTGADGQHSYDYVMTGQVIDVDSEKESILLFVERINKSIILSGRGMEIMPIPEPKQLTAELNSTEMPIPVAPWKIGKRYTIVRPKEEWTGKLLEVGIMDLMFDAGEGRRKAILPRCSFMHAFEELESAINTDAIETRAKEEGMTLLTEKARAYQSCDDATAANKKAESIAETIQKRIDAGQFGTLEPGMTKSPEADAWPVQPVKSAICADGKEQPKTYFSAPPDTAFDDMMKPFRQP